MGYLNSSSISRERHTVNDKPCAVGVRTFFLFEVEGDRSRSTTEVSFALVGQGKGKDSRLVCGNVTALVHVDIQFLVLEVQCTGRER